MRCRLQTPLGPPDLGYFLNTQEDWVLLTASQDQPVDEAGQIRRVLDFRPRSVRQYLWRRLALAFHRQEEQTAFFLSSLLHVIDGRHPGFLLRRAVAALSVGDTARARGLCREALAVRSHRLQVVRIVNRYHPECLGYPAQLILNPAPDARIAVLYPGELRLMERSLPLLKALAAYCQVFICCPGKDAARLHSLAGYCEIHVEILDDDPGLPHPAMQQWMRLGRALDMVERFEVRHGQPFTHVVKLRTDYYHADPERLMEALGRLRCGIMAASDKVFGGDRDSMMAFRDFHARITDYFLEPQHAFPIRWTQVLRSDDAFKWFGLRLPQAVLQEACNVGQVRRRLARMSCRDLAAWQEASDDLCRKPKASEGGRLMHTLYDSALPGTRVFASEICFAAFLNEREITVHADPCLSGVLWSDRGSAGEPMRAVKHGPTDSGLHAPVIAEAKPPYPLDGRAPAFEPEPAPEALTRLVDSLEALPYLRSPAQRREALKALLRMPSAPIDIFPTFENPFTPKASGCHGPVRRLLRILAEDTAFRSGVNGPLEAETFRDLPVAGIEELLMRWKGGDVWRGGPQPQAVHPGGVLYHYRGNWKACSPAVGAGMTGDWPILEEPLFWCGPLVGHFGHQLAEFGGRLLLSSLDRRPGSLVWLVPADRDLGEPLLPWQQAWLEYLNPTGKPIVLSHGGFIAKELRAHIQHQRLGESPSLALLAALGWRSRILDGDPVPDTIVLSRHRHAPSVDAGSLRGTFAGESAFDTWMAERDARIVYPEQLSFRGLLELLHRARRLVLSEGSALHALELLGHQPGKQVVVIARRALWPGMDSPLRARFPRLRWIDAVEEVHVPEGANPRVRGLARLRWEQVLRELGEELGIPYSSPDVAHLTHASYLQIQALYQSSDAPGRITCQPPDRENFRPGGW